MAEQVEPKLELATIRGIACVALVAYHVVGPTSASGMHLPSGSPWHLAMNSLDFLRMPMFSVLSGYLYAARRVDSGSMSQFAQKKAVRLLAPLMFVTFTMVALRHSVYGEETSYATALLFHYQHLWFLQALILIFIGISLWDALARPTWVGLSIAAFVSLMVSRTFVVSSFCSLDGALYLLPFFAGGMILRIEPTVLRSRNLVFLASSFVAAVIFAQQASIAFNGNSLPRNSMPAAVCGISASFLMLVLCPKVRFFERIAPFSFAIYLWHSIAASAARQVAFAHLSLPQVTEFSSLMIVGIAAPIGIQLASERIPLLSVLVAGFDSRSRRKRLIDAKLKPLRWNAATVGASSPQVDPDRPGNLPTFADADFSWESNIAPGMARFLLTPSPSPDGISKFARSGDVQPLDTAGA